MKKILIIPTYNEALNISLLIEKISELKISELDILIIDDNSPDKTANITANLQQKFSNLFLLTRPKKQGLGSAYLLGFNWAIEHNYEVAVQMDADFSHSPDDLIKIFEKLENNDLIIGSRYISSGGIIGWPISRLILSYFGNFYARLFFGKKIKDLTGGFNAWRIDLLKKINLETMQSDGYCFQAELKWRALKKGARVEELPIIFRERERGQSKMSFKIIFEAFWRIIKIRL